jgi:hypothetical protein
MVPWGLRIKNKNVGFEILTAVTVDSTIYRDMTFNIISEEYSASILKVEG